MISFIFSLKIKSSYVLVEKYIFGMAVPKVKEIMTKDNINVKSL